jgi:stage V sporulation protein G
MISITEVRVAHRPSPDGKLLGFATITLAGCLVIRGLKIIQGKGGVFVAMPCKKNTRTGAHMDLVFPNNQNMRDYIEDMVLDEFDKLEEAQ